MKMENWKHALTNTHSAERVSRNAVIKPIGLREFTTYIYQCIMADTQESQHHDKNIGPRKLTISQHEITADTKYLLQYAK